MRPVNTTQVELEAALNEYIRGVKYSPPALLHCFSDVARAMQWREGGEDAAMDIGELTKRAMNVKVGKRQKLSHSRE